MLALWPFEYKHRKSWVTRHTCSALLHKINSGGIILVTNVYGPSTNDFKPAFIYELRFLANLVHSPWMLGGDFNLVRWLIDRSGNQRIFTLMLLFNDLIRDLQLIDVPLENRRFTWCSNRPAPSHSKINRVFLAPEIALQFTLISLRDLEVMVSDHAP